MGPTPLGLVELRSYALTWLGTPYQWGGDGPRLDDPSRAWGFDCSGFVQHLLKAGGIACRRDFTAHELYLRFSRDGTATRCLGSLAFFAGRGGHVSHVGWMLDAELMISAAGGGPECTSPEAAKFRRAEIKIQPLAIYRYPAFLGAWQPFYEAR